MQDLASITWYAIGLSEVRTNEAYTVLKRGHSLCYCALADGGEREVGFMVNKNMNVGIEELYGVNERAEGLVIKSNNRHIFNIVQAYAPTSSDDHQVVESFYEDVNSTMSKVCCTDGRLRSQSRQEADCRPSSGEIWHKIDVEITVRSYQYSSQNTII